jgi:hypothetical protein
MALGVFEYEYGDRGVRAGAGFGRGSFDQGRGMQRKGTTDRKIAERRLI